MPVLIVLVALGCKTPTTLTCDAADGWRPPEVDPAGAFDIDASRAAWEDIRAEHGDHYLYSRWFESWVGFGQETTVEVRGDEVVARHVRAWDDAGDQATFLESEDTVGAGDQGFPPDTMEDLYRACTDEVLGQDPVDNEVVFETWGGGVLHRCTYRPLNCADDCTQGVAMATLTLCQP